MNGFHKMSKRIVWIYRYKDVNMRGEGGGSIHPPGTQTSGMFDLSYTFENIGMRLVFQRPFVNHKVMRGTN